MKGYFVLFLTFGFCFAGQLKKRENFWYITGKGCGISTELKYLNEIPENPEEMSCVIIRPKDMKKVDDPADLSLHCPFLDTDIHGSGHVYFLDIESAFECRRMCNHHEKCEAFIFVPKPLANGARAKDCHMKWSPGVRPEASTAGQGNFLSGYKNCKNP